MTNATNEDQGHYTKRDKQRLAKSRLDLAAIMLDGQWHDPYELAKRLNAPNPGTMTSHIRDLKASGLYDYERRRHNAKHEYRLTIKEPSQMTLLKESQAPADPIEQLPEGFVEIISTNVRAVRWTSNEQTLTPELETGELQVLYKSGGRYHYQDVPRQGFDNMLKAESAGRFLGANIKPHFKAYRADWLTGMALKD